MQECWMSAAQLLHQASNLNGQVLCQDAISMRNAVRSAHHVAQQGQGLSCQDARVGVARAGAHQEAGGDLRGKARPHISVSCALMLGNGTLRPWL
jgi:hypothetical protein